MGDGLLGKCKECTKKDVKERQDSEDGQKKIREYEKDRSQTFSRKALFIAAQQRRRHEHPEKNRAYCAVERAIKNGTLKRLPCEICGETKSEAHHEDYYKPLEVKWLCKRHHEDLHHR
jgi:hypothetical protein